MIFFAELEQSFEKSLKKHESYDARKLSDVILNF